MSSSQHYYRTLLGLFQSRSRSALKRGLDQARKALESDEGQFKRICAKLLRDVRCPVPHHQKARRQDFTKRVFAVMGAAGIKTWLDEEGSPEPAQPSPAAEQCQVLLIPDHMCVPIQCVHVITLSGPLVMVPMALPPLTLRHV